MAYARFGDVWTKLRAFELAEYERVIMVDSDMLVRRNMDELMTLPLDDGMQIAAGFACTCNPAKMASYPKDW
jgi:alpha-N-acetylglucosamine transferase